MLTLFLPYMIQLVPSPFSVQKNTILFFYSKEYNCPFDIVYDILWLTKVVHIHLVKNIYLFLYLLDFLVYSKSSQGYKMPFEAGCPISK